GVEQAQRASTPRVDAVHMQHVDGHQTLMLWARTAAAAQVEVGAAGDKALLVDQYGAITLLRPTNGIYTLSLPGATCNEVDGCAVGGAVWLLVQPVGESVVRESRETGSVSLTFQE